MAKCPYCNSRNVSCTNRWEIIGANAFSTVVCGIGKLIGVDIHPGLGTISSRRNVEYKEYHCNDCRRNFKKSRMSGEIIKENSYTANIPNVNNNNFNTMTIIDKYPEITFVPASVYNPNPKGLIIFLFVFVTFFGLMLLPLAISGENSFEIYFGAMPIAFLLIMAFGFIFSNHSFHNKVDYIENPRKRKYCRIVKDGKFGVYRIDKRKFNPHKIIIPTIYDYIQQFDGIKFVAKKGKDTICLDEYGNILK